MIITFCGHSDFHGGSEYEKQILDYLEAKVIGEDVEFYLGGYGGFDSFALSCAKKYREKYRNAKVVFVTPYIDDTYLKNHFDYTAKSYDEIIYPDLESVPPRYAISKRNEWLVKKADLVIAYVNHSYGGAYKTFSLAKRRGKEVLNLGTLKAG